MSEIVEDRSELRTLRPRREKLQRLAERVRRALLVAIRETKRSQAPEQSCRFLGVSQSAPES